MRISVVRIDGRCFQLPPEISPASKTRGNVSQLAPKRLIQEVQNEGRAEQRKILYGNAARVMKIN
jgi:hypothetical protein